METMVERVAKALCRAAGHNPDAPNPDKEGEPFWFSDRPYARAAIEAMREPAPAMCKAVDGIGGLYGSDLRVILSTAFDAALSESMKEK